MAWTSTRMALKKLPCLLPGRSLHYTFDGIPLNTGQLTFRKQMNLFLCGMDSILRHPRIHALPPALQIEPTNICNLKCPLCPTGTDRMHRPRGHMKMKTFNRLLAELEDVLVGIILYGWGEPFLNPHMPEMIKACSERGMATVTSTNGQCLQTMEKALAIVDAGLSGLIIALDGANQEVYGRYRRSGKVNKVFRCAELLSKAKALRGSKTPVTNLRMVMTRDNEHEIPKLKNLAIELGVDQFSYKIVRSLIGNITNNTNEYSPSFLRFQNSMENKAKQTVACPYIFRQPTVFWDGTVVGCEFDYNLESAWGNIHEKTFSEIWNGKTAIKMRRGFRRKHKNPSFCRRCPYRELAQNQCVVECKDLADSI